MGSKLIINIRAYGTIFLLAGGLLFSAFHFAWDSSLAGFNRLWLVAVLSVCLPSFVSHKFVSKLWSRISPVDYPTLWETEAVAQLPVLILTPIFAYIGGLYAAHEAVSFMMAFLPLIAIASLFGYAMLRYVHYLDGSPDLVAQDEAFHTKPAAKPASAPIKMRKVIAALAAPIAYMLCLILIVAGVVMVRSLIMSADDLWSGNIFGSLMNISENMYGAAKGMLGCGISFMFIAIICDPLVSWGRRFRERFLSVLKGSVAIDFGLGFALLQSIICGLSTAVMFFTTPESLAGFAAWSLVAAYILLVFSGFAAGAVYAVILGGDGNDSPNLPVVAQTVSDKRSFVPQRWQAES